MTASMLAVYAWHEAYGLNECVLCFQTLFLFYDSWFCFDIKPLMTTSSKVTWPICYSLLA